MHEKKLDFSLVFEPIWEKRTAFMIMSHDNTTPVLRDLNGTLITSCYAATEYLEDIYPETPLLPEKPGDRAEVRRLLAWFHNKMGGEVTRPLVHEKTIKRHIKGSDGPDSSLLRKAKQGIHLHMEYISWLIEQRRWIAGEFFSLADLAAAAHLSSLDYMGDVPWAQYPSVKQWYACLKSRPSFRGLLSDRLPGMAPRPHYNNLDF